MIDELTQEVARTAKVSPAQAALAVKAMLRFLTARLPSRLVGEMVDCLKKASPPQAFNGFLAPPPPSRSTENPK